MLRTIATQASGVAELMAAIECHLAYLKATGEWQAREHERLQTELNQLLQAVLVARWREGVSDAELRDVVARLQDRELSPLKAVEQLLDLDAVPESY